MAGTLARRAHPLDGIVMMDCERILGMVKGR